MHKLIPPVLVLALLGALYALQQFHPDSLLMRRDRPMPWDIVLIIGVAILVWSRVHFLRRDAEINTFKKPHALVTDGPFRFSRNPMYLGFLLIVLAAAFYVNTWCALLAPLAFLIASAMWYIPYEEQNLRETFGAAYENYAEQTRRWI